METSRLFGLGDMFSWGFIVTVIDLRTARGRGGDHVSAVMFGLVRSSRAAAHGVSTRQQGRPLLFGAGPPTKSPCQSRVHGLKVNEPSSSVFCV